MSATEPIRLRSNCSTIDVDGPHLGFGPAPRSDVSHVWEA